MFEVTLVDHLRLTFGHVVYRHKAHTRIAYTRGRWSRWLRGAEAVLMTAVALTALGAAFGRGDVRVFAIASAVFSNLALVILILHLTFDFEATAQAHGLCATRLWQIREQYRALLSDLADGTMDLETARRRRDALMNELDGIYQNAPPADQQAYQSAAQAAAAMDEGALTDEEIDRFLPKSLQKSDKSAAA